MPSGEPVFDGVIGRTYQESTPSWPQPVSAPAGAPNVVFILLDDVGFAHLGCYGSTIETPNMDRLANGGLRYTNFHTTAMCSPTRAALMTGRNHHAAGLGIVTEFATGYPGYAGRLTKRAATLAEMLRPQGYNTFVVGKWHLMPLREATAAGPFDAWPLQRGFDRWYGFPAGYTDQWSPELCEGNEIIETPRRPGYHVSDDLVDHAIQYVRDQQSVATGKPFFLYTAFGAAHWPHQAPAAYIDKYRGRFDAGWDVVRGEWLANQKAMGIVPADTELPPLNDDVPAWDELTTDEQRVAARQMEVYAGFLDHTDAQIGRLVDYLEEIDQLDNTMIVLLSDNGASNEGTRVGCLNVYKAYASQIQEPLELSLEALDRLGDETTNVHYPTGWAQAGNTPFKWYKKNTHGGGVRDPLIVHWPTRIKQAGLRHQYHHVTDLVPTVLELLDLEAPAILNDVPQLPIHGTSLSYTFDEPEAPTQKEVQYFEMLGNRAIWHRGWKAVAKHQSGTDFDRDQWELYHLDEDYAEERDLAAQQPEKVREMVDRWWVEAGKYDVLPLDDRDVGFLRSAGRPGVKTRFVYYPGMARVERQSSPNITNRSYAITADVTIPEGGAEGVLLAAGNRFGGYALFLKDGRLVYEYNFGDVRYVISSDTEIAAGTSTYRFEFAKTGRHQGRGTLLVDGTVVGDGELPQTWPFMAAQAGLHCGRDDGSPVSDQYAVPFTFTGALHRVVVELADDQQRDLAAEHRVALAEQ
jgi:arylsulfatase